MRTHTKFGIKGTRAGAKNCAVARPIHVSSSHNKFGWFLSNGLGGSGITDRQTDGGNNNIPSLFQKSVGLIYNLAALDTCMFNGLSLVYCIKPERRIHYYTKG